MSAACSSALLHKRRALKCKQVTAGVPPWVRASARRQHPSKQANTHLHLLNTIMHSRACRCLETRIRVCARVTRNPLCMHAGFSQPHPPCAPIRAAGPLGCSTQCANQAGSACCSRTGAAGSQNPDKTMQPKERRPQQWPGAPAPPVGSAACATPTTPTPAHGFCQRQALG